MTFGEKLKAIRESKGLSQKQLGEKMGVTQQTIAQYEKIKEQPKMKTVRKLAAALDITLSELVIDWGAFTQEEIVRDVKNLPLSAAGIAISEPLTDDLPERAEQMTSYGKNLLETINKLNDEGQQKVKDYADDLSENPRYQKGAE